MNRLFIITLCVSCLTLAGCGAMKPANPEVVASADYGAYPKNYESIVKNYISSTLKDPFSARFQFRKPFKAYLRDAPVTGGKPSVFGYMVYANVNAKNSYGAYVGWKPYKVLIRNGVVVGEASYNGWFSEEWYR